jgi:hypothetical protein
MGTEVERFRKVESACAQVSSKGVLAVVNCLYDLSQASHQSSQDLGNDLGKSKQYVLAMLRAHRLAAKHWGGAPATDADCQLFTAIAYGYLLRTLRNNPHLLALAEKIGIAPKARSAPTAKPTSEKLAAALRAAMADGWTMDAVLEVVERTYEASAVDVPEALAA